MACDKVLHLSETAALKQLKALKVTSKENKKQRTRLCVYFCATCGGWHIGHDRRRGKQYAKTGRKMRSPYRLETP